MKEEFFTHEEPKSKRKKLTDEEKKEKQRAYAKAWYERNQASGTKVKRQSQKKKSSKGKKSPLNAEHSSLTFLFFMIGKDEYTEPVVQDKAQQRAQEIFADPDYDGAQQIYFMKPLRLFNRPIMQITEL